MTQVEQIIEEAQSRIRSLTNTDVELIIKSVKHKHLELYGEIWMICYRVALDHLSSYKEDNVYQLIMNAQYCYAKIITTHFTKLSIASSMHVIGRDRTTYYNLHKCADKFIQTNDLKFMVIYDAINEAIKKSDLLPQIDKANA